MSWFLTALLLSFAWLSDRTSAFTVVLAGGTGPIGQAVATKLEDADVVMLTRNSFLASAPNRVTNEFGFVGANYLRKNPHVSMRDWDGGDLLDIVGRDWVGWQEDTLKKANVVVHLVGGFTEQRTMACERLVRESFQWNKNALQVTVSPSDESLGAVAPSVAKSFKTKRIQQCEDMVQANCLYSECLRIDAYQLEKSSDEIVKVILQAWEKQ